jgi:hypothetical protein
MFSSSILDVVVGLIFSFFALSLATGAIVEAISSAINLRSKTLKTGIQQILNDQTFTGLAKDLYAHAAVNPRGPGATNPGKNAPAYIDPIQFANALLDITGITGAAASPSAVNATNPSEKIAAVTDGLKVAAPGKSDDQLKDWLEGVIKRNLGKHDDIRSEVAAWFDNAMDRVSGTYKRWSQLVSFIVALVLATVLNVDAMHIETSLWAHPSFSAQIKTQQYANPADALHAVDATLPIGWPRGLFTNPNGTAFSRGDGVRAFIGWLLAAFATLFGAPFWFDILQGTVRLRGSGSSPADKVKSGEKTTATT